MSQSCSVCGEAATNVIILGPKFGDPPDNAIVGVEAEWRCVQHAPVTADTALT